MPDKYSNCQWVVQKNLTSKEDYEGIKNACEKIGVGFIGLNIIPFSAELPPFEKSKRSIIYGSTTFNNLADKDTSIEHGLFFNAMTFSIENYIEKWGKHMLNYNATVTSFKFLIENQMFGAEKLLFIRPDDDTKSFSGEVKQYDEIEEWYHNLKTVENNSLTPDSKIIVSEPYNIQYEWRLWVVNKKVIAASKYREYFNLKKEEGCPNEVVEFAEARCKEYTPHDVFVMDVCICGDEYYIVECGCVNAAGFYKADIECIIKNITDYFVGIYH